MTVSTTKAEQVHVGNGAATSFSTNFKVLEAEDLTVLLRVIATGVETVLQINTDYTVSGLGSDNGVTVTYPVSGDPLTSDEQLVLFRESSFTQPDSIRNQTGFFPSVLEDGYDRLVLMAQENKAKTDRTIRAAIGSTFDTTFPLLDGNRTIITASDGKSFIQGPTAAEILNAESSAQAAAASAQDANDTLIAFETSYLGAFDSDPATDNEGGALKEGALYYNTVLLEVRSYDGTDWSSLATANATLTSIGTLGTAADKALYTTGVDTWAEMNVTASGRAVLALEDADERLVPAGAVQYFAMDAPPTGWLRADGALIDRTTYAALFNAIGTTYGTTDASNFQLPDLRGEFVRGHDAGIGRDPGRAFGSKQGDMIAQHRHAFAHITNVSPNGSTSEYDSADTALDASSAPGVNPDKTSDVLNLSDNDALDYAGHENRPRNIALLPCIKY